MIVFSLLWRHGAVMWGRGRATGNLYRRRSGCRVILISSIDGGPWHGRRFWPLNLTSTRSLISPLDFHQNIHILVWLGSAVVS